MTQSSQKDIQTLVNEATSESKKQQLEIEEKNEVMQMRREWSNFFKKVVVTILVFEVLLTFLVGSKLMQFKDEWFLRIIILGGFAQILIMPFTLTKFLFNVDSNLSKK